MPWGDGANYAFARNGGARLRVQVLYRGGVGGLLGGAGSLLGVSDVADVPSGGDWQPSPEVGMLGGVLPLLTRSVQFGVRSRRHDGCLADRRRVPRSADASLAHGFDRGSEATGTGRLTDLVSAAG